MDLTTGPSHAAKDAAAVLKPTYFKKSRRVVLELSKESLSPKNSSVGISSTNSFCCRALTIELSSFSSSTLFQYFLFDDILYNELLLIIFNYLYLYREFNSGTYHILNLPFELL